MVEAAAPFVRVLVRVPEGYLLVTAYDTTRPALLVIDADGRRVDSIPLLGSKPEDIAAKLVAARTAKATERFVLTGVDPEKLRGAGEVARRDEYVIVTAEAGSLSPATLRKLAGNPGRLVVHHPIAIRAPQKQAGPGTWYRDGDRIWVARLLLHPGLHLAGDIEMRTFDLPGVSRGAEGARVARAPFGAKGVLSVFPDIFRGTEAVVGRRGEVDWKAVRAAFAKAGCEAKEK